MASIFLSYAREDLAKARRLAAILEQRGHSVWWDRQIRGGARFAGAIEDALRNADYVVVLWSKNSIGSAWVCDEASEGRDTNRLVRVLLENVRPPIGFRQFHCVDLSSWKTKEQGDALDELSAALGSKAGSRPVGEGSFARWRRLLNRPIVIAVAAAVLIAALIGAAIWMQSPAETSEPTIASRTRRMRRISLAVPLPACGSETTSTPQWRFSRIGRTGKDWSASMTNRPRSETARAGYRSQQSVSQLRFKRAGEPPTRTG